MKKKNRKNKKLKVVRGKTRTSLSAKKRRNKDLFDIKLKSGYKEKTKIEKLIDNTKMNFSEFPDTQVKITFYANKGKQKANLSFIYDLDEGENKRENNQTIKDAIKDVLNDIFTKKTEREKTKSWQRIQPIKNYISKMIIDFETPDSGL
jgi:hypothetical protein